MRLRVALSLIALAAAAVPAQAKDLPIDLLNAPDGFKIAIYAEDVDGARSLAVSPKGTVFIGTRGADHFYAVEDKDGDHVAETVHTLGSGLNSPNGMVFHDGALYVAEISRILKYNDIENHLDALPEPEVVIDTLPTEEHHGWKYMAMGPDGKLYFNIGAPCNLCNKEEEDERFATISRVNTDGSDFEIVARGVRNSVGITWDPTTGQMWFTDNNRDLMGDDRPACELNHATEQGQHFGFPYCHQGDLPDPEFIADRDCSEFTPPALKLQAHVAPLGLKFYTGTMFPEEYRGAIFVAEHGSWNRSIPIGYRIAVVKPDADGNCTSADTFIDGWLRRLLAWGRPVDILFLEDGSMLVSDDKGGVLYRISYGE
ncbi:MAG: sorbosone dehydrogenase family protein [Candidatus Hydrogenedens sp.]|nr:sorbosone dehydrogenase family protein [Candidatus Hydrogenedens sp.]